MGFTVVALWSSVNISQFSGNTTYAFLNSNVDGLSHCLSLTSHTHTHTHIHTHLKVTLKIVDAPLVMGAMPTGTAAQPAQVRAVGRRNSLFVTFKKGIVCVATQRCTRWQ